MNILLVDDEFVMLEQLEMMLQNKFPKWNIYTAIDASQALTKAKEHKIHLAFLDIKLPGKSGLDLGKELKDIHAQIDLVIITAYQYFDYAKQSVRIGAIDFLTKPIIENELNHVLNKYESISSYSPPINDALIYIQDHFSNRITLSDVAKHVHCNATYISRRFTEEVGINFNEYLTNYRIEMSKQYLISHMDWAISQIAEKVGFSSQHYFSTIFRKVVHVSPKEYRERELAS
ncbi:response regulator [Niallia sp. NCCP-28]|uniref:response regulator transcription factor n=1 Tax=Niallia sp. NCCP-28 TaxID=2934712 RepID=UPI00208B500A|nr:helix-turn-helix domain-containing protein [Niallia sp. NCCP-28]GKU85084.1 DNA-binding response regulator [Niallia sp. NCCP-28]